MHYISALYDQPTDPDHFRNYYTTVHLPLAAALPGLLHMHHSFEVEPLGPGKAVFCIWTGAFANEGAALAALGSPEGQAVAADVPNYASGGVTLFRYTGDEYPR